jgi:bacteriorhodopsin
VDFTIKITGGQTFMLSEGQFDLIYNALSLGLAAMAATTVFMLVAQPRVLQRYRLALVASASVTFIAAYHYWRIFDSFKAAAAGTEVFNEAYRYVDWLLTVPLLLVEVITVLALPAARRSSLLNKLIPASAAMIILGYPGEITSDLGPKAIWGALSTLPFIYILFVLFVELTKSLEGQPAEVKATIGRLRLLLIATWGVYPISYLFPMIGDWTGSEFFTGTDGFVARQLGYTIADILAKCLFGLVIFKIARLKSMADDSAFAAAEAKH